MGIGNMEYWILAQVILECLLVAVTVYFLIKIRQLSNSGIDPAEVKKILQDTHRLKDELVENLEGRKTIISNLVKQLDQRIESAQKLVRSLESQSRPNRQGQFAAEKYGTTGLAPTMQERVELMHRQGYPLDDIAQQLNMSKGEVMLVLDLSRAKLK
jgi:hypothetical protein